MWSRREVDRLPPSNAKVTKEWSSNPVVPECLVDVERDRETALFPCTVCVNVSTVSDGVMSTVHLSSAFNSGLLAYPAVCKYCRTDSQQCARKYALPQRVLCRKVFVVRNATSL